VGGGGGGGGGGGNVLIGVAKNSEVIEHRTFASVVDNFRFVKLLVKRN